MALRDRRLRVLFYVQHLSGVGHFMRARTIARELAASHDVWLTDGGRPVPTADDARVHLLRLPRLHRVSGELVPLESGRSLAAVWRERRERLSGAVMELRPDVVVIEHFPFSKWELADEIGFLLEHARESNPASRRICSVRDIPLQTRHEACAPDVYAGRVVRSLNGQFDALMVHSDENLCPLHQAFPEAGRIRLPIRHTGMVCQDLPPRLDPAPDTPFAVASVGGGSDANNLLRRLAGEWTAIRDQAGLSEWELVMFGGLGDATSARSAPSRAGDSPVRWRSFSEDYLAWLAHAGLSISCAGYNTCANLLRIGTPAVLVPNTAMSDQVQRSHLLQSRGLVDMLLPDAWNASRAANAIRRRVDAPREPGQLDLRGAEGSRHFVEEVSLGLTD
jgi:predicted glycosyltransferase